ETEGMVIHLPVVKRKGPQQAFRPQIAARTQDLLPRAPARAAKRGLTSQPVIESQSAPNHPCRPAAVLVHRELDFHGPGQMRSPDNPPPALLESLSHQLEMALLQVAQSP